MGMVANLVPTNTGAIISSALGALTSLIPYKKETYFVDASKTTVTILEGFGHTPTPAFEVTKFPDDVPGIQVEPVTLLQTGTSYNGKLISWDEIEKVRITLSVIPHTDDEKNLMHLCSTQDLFTKGKVESDFSLGLRISQKKMTKFPTTPIGSIGSETKLLSTTFYNGKLLEVEGGYDDAQKASAHSVTTDGRLNSNRFVFEFTQWDNSMDEPPKKSFLEGLKDMFSIP